MYEAPTTSVFPGRYCFQNISSEVKQYYLAPGISGYVGLPPVAIKILFVVTVYFFPLFAVSSISFGDLMYANLL